jgi:hypothetical protein
LVSLIEHSLDIKVIGGIPEEFSKFSKILPLYSKKLANAPKSTNPNTHPSPSPP